MTDNGPFEVIGALLDFLQGLRLILGIADDGGNASLADIVKDGPELLRGGGLLGDVELEIGLLGGRIVRYSGTGA